MADHMSQLQGVVDTDVKEITAKESTYCGSWKKRGGAGAFHMVARKWDRLEVMQSKDPDVFAACLADPSGADGTMLAEIRDLRRYLVLIEAEVQARRIEERQIAEVVGATERIIQATGQEPPIPSGGGSVGLPQPFGREALTEVSDAASFSQFVEMADRILPALQRSAVRYEKLAKADPTALRRLVRLRTALNCVEALVVPEDARFF